MGLFSKIGEKKRKEKEEKERQAQELLEKKNLALKLLRENGILPEVVGTPLILKNGEVCHYCGRARRLITKEKTVGYAGGTAGVSVRVAKGVTLRTGGIRAHAVKQNVQEGFSGVLYFTNKRIVFQADQNGFSLTLGKLVSTKRYTDGVGLYKDNGSYTVTVDDADYCNEILSGIVSEI